MYYVGHIMCDPDYLAHHGIKGQTWGVRRYQNEDGTWTEAGKERRNNGMLEARLAITAATALAVGGVMAANSLSAKYKTRKIQKRIESQPLDPKTGLHLKGDVQFTEKEDAKQVNPGFRNLSNDTKNNCTLCALTYEMRRRGYDVVANKSATGFTDKDINKWFPDAKFDYPDEGKPISILKSDAALHTLEKLRRQPPNTRGILNMSWLGSFSGHSVAYYTNNDGALFIADAQTGETLSGKDIDRLLKTCWMAEYARLDTVAFNYDTIKEVCT